jgi:glycogen/starch synthases, ADP-glucose type
MRKKLKILYITAEISPYASAGGLGEVGRSFPNALQKTGTVEVRRVMPLYKQISKKLKYLTDFPVGMDTGYETCVLKTDAEGEDVPTYFIGNDRYFYRDQIYSYEDDGFRFFFFCKAVAEMMKRIDYQPDIVHSNDWHTGFLSLLIKKDFPSAKTVFTIHNICYHGYIPPAYLSDQITQAEAAILGDPEWLDFMKAGIRYADLVTTVSPGYREEIQQPSNSSGMSELIEERQASFVGILNGIDTELYDPMNDGVLAYPYDFTTIEQKKKNRTLLRQRYGLPDTEVPLLALITRLEYAKGMDVLMKAISFSDISTFQLIILGSGNPYYMGLLQCIAEQYPENIVFLTQYTAELAKQIYAAADIYLMPSFYEPCGLGQLYAMRYGAVPVVNPVGGLKDTVIDDKKKPSRSSGFYMQNWTGKSLTKAVKRAVKAYYTPRWSKLIQNGMNYNSSWERSVSECLKYYELLADSTLIL